ncbi:MAG: DUF167 domain-containing protein [Sulfurifustaceae bacterium]
MTAKLAVKVIPKAARDGVAGWMSDVLKVRVTAAPERGKANTAVLGMIAAALRVPRDSVRLIAGAASERKLLEIDGLTDAELRARLGECGKTGLTRHGCP